MSTNGKQPSVSLTGFCKASPAQVYKLLTDVSEHLKWAGEEQPGYFRLLSLEAPNGQATVGTEFISTGSIPGTNHRFHDKSRVTEMIENSVFEFVTESTVQLNHSKKMEAVYVHRYEIIPEDGGCRVNYTFRQEKITNPMLRLALPVVRTMTWNFGMPFMMRGGFNNLLKMAENRAPA